MHRYPIHHVNQHSIVAAGTLMGLGATSVVLGALDRDGCSVLSRDSIWGICHGATAKAVVISGRSGLDPLSVPGIADLVERLLADHDVIVQSPCTAYAELPAGARLSWVIRPTSNFCELAAVERADEMVFVLPMLGAEPFAHVDRWQDVANGRPMYIQPAVNEVVPACKRFVLSHPGFFLACVA